MLSYHLILYFNFKKKKKSPVVPKHPLGETEEWREQAAGSRGPGPSHAVWF